MYICLCRNVTDSQIHQAVQQGASSMADLNRQLGVATQCGQCHQMANQCLKKSLQALSIQPKQATKTPCLTTLE